MPRTKKRENSNKQKSIAIQTDDIASSDEIVRLHEQLRMLQLENDILKKRIDDNVLPAKGTLNKIEVESTNTPKRVNKIIKEDPQILKSATKQRTCTCKGNCSSRCGCVKNELKCSSSCKCDAQICQNQEAENKENIGDAQNEVVHKTQKLENVHLTRNIKIPSLFSLEDTENEMNLDNIEFNEISFHTKKQLTYPSDEILEDEDIEKVEHNIIKIRNKGKKEHKSIADKERVTTSKKQKKVEKKNVNGNNQNKAQKHNKMESGKNQKSPSSEEDDKKSSSDADTSFDPMKPKRQLPRTPPHGNIEHNHPNISLNHETSTEKIELKIDKIPEELNQENVDLNKLSIELVSCNRCKRRFYPWRIDVHQSACLGL